MPVMAFNPNAEVSRRIGSGLRSYLPEDLRDRVPEMNGNSHHGFLGRIFRRSAMATNSNA
jgi:hypothetical protein